MSSVIHPHGRPLEWLELPLASLWTAAAHPLRAEEHIEGSQYVVRAEVPGCDPRNDIEVTAARGILTIRAERRPSASAGHHSEFRYGSFTRSFRLPPSADEHRIRAICGNGILEVTADLAAGDAKQPPRQVPVMVNHYIDPT
jgi:HSP20 family protein